MALQRLQAPENKITAVSMVTMLSLIFLGISALSVYNCATNLWNNFVVLIVIVLLKLFSFLQEDILVIKGVL